jgi:thiamine-phosphate diphosphorylase
MLVTDDRLLAGRDLVEVAERAVRGGVTAIQLRLKLLPARTLLELAVRLRAAVPVPVLINDRPDVAAAAGCGVHLGPDDLSPLLARRILPVGTLLGVSVGNEREAAVEGKLAADYWGVGPWRVTRTKADAGAAIGSAGFQRVVSLAGGRPCIAIGGIRPEDCAAVLASGGAGVAVVSGILGQDDVELAARRYALALG